MTRLTKAQENARATLQFRLAWWAVFVFAEWAHSLEQRIINIGPMLIRPEFEDRGEYGDDHDFRIHLLGEVGPKRFDMKWRQTLAFTSARDFPYKTILLDKPGGAAKSHKATETIDFFVSMSADCNYVAIVDCAKTRKYWEMKEIDDGVKPYKWKGWACPTHLATFHKIREPGVTISDLVKKLLDAGATAEVVAIAIQALEEEREPEPIKRRRAKAQKGEMLGAQ